MTKSAEKQNRFRFTEARLRGVEAPASGRLHLYDLDVPELELRVTPTGAKSFSVYLWSSTHGKPMRAFLGRWPTLTVESARKLARQRSAEIVSGGDPTQAKRAIREETTVGDAIELYFGSMKAAGRKETTFSLYRYLVERFLKTWSARRLSSVTTDAVLTLRSKIRDQDGTGAIERTGTRPEKSNRIVSANRSVRLLSQAFNHAIRNGWKGTNPCEAIKPFPERSSTRRIEDYEIGPFISACEAMAGEGDQVGDYLIACLFSGVRRRNVASARWDAIDLDRGTWDVPETKNGLPLRVYLSPYLKTVFQRRHRQRSFSPYVFAAAGKSGWLNDPRKGLARAIRMARIDDSLTIHALKHTWVSYCYDAGLNPVLVSRLGGHKMPGITARYGHASDAKVREAYSQVAAHILSVARPSKVVHLAEVSGG